MDWGPNFINLVKFRKVVLNGIGSHLNEFDAAENVIWSTNDAH